MRILALAIFSILSLVVLSGCVQNPDDAVVCNRPYIRVGESCCLDGNANGICDGDEKTIKQAEDEKTQCNKPYILIGRDCCLDKDGSGICDKDEVSPTNPPLPTTTIAQTTTTSPRTPDLVCNPPYIRFESGCCLDENGNRICDRDETDTTQPPGACGDGACTSGESSASCCSDCGCPANYTCEENSCQEIKRNGTVIIRPFFPTFELIKFCGDGVCSAGETSSSCCMDCDCPAGKFCINNSCTSFFIGGGGILGRYPVHLLNITQPKPSNTYIVVVLDSIRIIDDKDPAGDGEIMVVSAAGSAGNVQTVQWPIQMWHEADSGTLLLGGDRNAIPVFAMKESEMGDDLNVMIAALDNDEYPGWLETAIRAGGKINEWVPLIGKPYSQFHGKFADWLGSNDEVGTLQRTFRKSDDWGVSSSEYYTQVVGSMEVRYSIRRVVVPDNMRVTVTLKRIKYARSDYADGDYCCGETFLFTRVADGFSGDYLRSTEHRYPEGRSYYQDCSKMHWYSGCEDQLDPYDMNKVIFDRPNVGPFLFVEVDVWDEDEPSVGDDNDQLGILSQLWLATDSELSGNMGDTRTIKISENRHGVGQGDITIELEVKRYPYS